MMEEFEVTKVDSGGAEAGKVMVATEAPLTVVIGDKELTTLICTPSDLYDLILGFIFGLGLIKSPNDLKVTIDETIATAYVTLKSESFSDDLVFKRVYTSGCGRGIFLTTARDALSQKEVVSDLKISAPALSRLMNAFKANSALHAKTRGVHSAALSHGQELDIFMDDIGRHNAIDKVIGAALKLGFDMTNSILLTSGRITSEVIFKMERASIPIVASKSAPTDQAIRLGQKFNITVVGAVRGEKMNIYSMGSRIVV